MKTTWHTPEVLQRTSWLNSSDYLPKQKKHSKKGKKRKNKEGAGWINEDIQTYTHVYPVADFVEHLIDTEGDCICGPETVFGNSTTLYVHESLDGREFHETGFTKYREVW